MAVPLALPSAAIIIVVLLLSSGLTTAEVEVAAVLEEVVLTLDVSNFSEVVGKLQFIVVEFYAPWCIHSCLIFLRSYALTHPQVSKQ